MAYVTVVMQLMDVSYLLSCGDFVYNLQENHCKPPDFEVQSRREEAFESERFRVTIRSISVDTTDNECALSLVEELPRLMRFVRKVNEEDECQQTYCACDLLETLVLPFICLESDYSQLPRG